MSEIQRDPWQKLRSLTSARIALGRAGGSVPTRELLDFQAAHAAARDAVHQPFDAEQVAGEVQTLDVETILVESQAPDRTTYLTRPDLGRRLSDDSRGRLKADASDLCIIVTDGLSATAAHRQTLPLLSALLPPLKQDLWKLSPIIIARFGRVAIQDDIGQALGASIAVILVGERPGLGSPDSLGAYLVHGPAVGKTDADRNCISNIRPEGLPPSDAAERLLYLLNESRRRKISGIALKDERAAIEKRSSSPLPREEGAERSEAGEGGANR